MKNTLKKVLFSLWAITLLWAWSIGLVNAQNANWNWDWNTNTVTGMPQQNWTYKINDREITAGWSNYLLTNAIRLVNWIMSLLSVVALVVLLIWWFKMITANWDDGKYKKWLSVLKQAAIWLVIIWLSWAIIRLIFRFINKTDNTNSTADYNSNS